jgi:hypothetical protein
VLAGAAGVLLAASGMAVTTALTATPAAAATSSTCGFATPGTGTFASTLCWFDLSAYNPTQAATGQPMSMSLPGGYTLSFTMTVSGGPVSAVKFPTWSGAYLGNNGHYSGVPGKPALYQTTSGTTTTATLSNISMTDANGHVVSGYALVGADAESTDVNESIQWTSSAPITSLTASGTSTGLGNACGGGFTGVGTTTVLCTGSATGTKTGTAILASTAPTTFSQQFKGGGLQGVAFGVLVSSVQLTTTIVNGFPGDSFGAAITDSTGGTVSSVNTAGGSSATTGSHTVVVNSGGSTFDFGQQITSGLASDYTTTWSCTRNGQPDPSLPSGQAGYDNTVSVGIGDFVACTIVNTAKTATLSLVKHAGTPVDVNNNGLVDAGDTILYTFTVTNTGQLPLSTVGVTDNKAGPVSCPPGDLAPGASVTCTADAPYTVTAADVSAGSVNNTATASGFPPGATAPVTSNPSSTTTPTEAPDPAISIVKSATPSGASDYTAGQVITYSFVVTNTGNVTLTNVTVNDAGFSGTGQLSPLDCPGGLSSMAPQAQEVCTATYTLTQDDVNATRLENGATATGVPPEGPPVTSPPSEVTIPIAANPTISLVKTVTPTTATGPGDAVTYHFAITNTGNVTLTSPSVDEQSFTGTGGTPAANCPSGPFIPGATVVCTADYTLTQADVDAGTVENTAVASALDPAEAPITSNASNATVTIPAAPSISLHKSASAPNGTAVGDTVDYAFAVTNTGNVTLQNVGVAETEFTGHGSVSAVDCPVTTLAAGASTTCTATYVLTQADIDAGEVDNTATVHGTPPTGAAAVSDPSSASVPLARNAAIALVKTADPTTVAAVGNVVTYSFLITNTGNVTLSSPTVSEVSFTGSGAMSAVTCEIGISIAPGDSTTCTADYTVTQKDLDRGAIDNTATVTGTAPFGVDDPTSSPSSATVTVTATPLISLLKTADRATVTAVGQTITYSFAVTNDGPLTVGSLAIRELSFNGAGAIGRIQCPAAPIAPGATATCTATYTTSAADLTGQPLTNTAVAFASSLSGGSVESNPSSARVDTVKAPTSVTPLVLASTGSDLRPWVGVGSLILLSGAALIVIALRRPRRG